MSFLMTVVSLFGNIQTSRSFCPNQATVSCPGDVDLVGDDSMTWPSAGRNSVLCSPNVQTHTHKVGLKETCLKWASVFSTSWEQKCPESFHSTKVNKCSCSTVFLLYHVVWLKLYQCLSSQITCFSQVDL